MAVPCDLLEHDNQATRAELRELFRDTLFTPRYNISLDEERELALKRLQKICSNFRYNVNEWLTVSSNEKTPL